MCIYMYALKIKRKKSNSRLVWGPIGPDLWSKVLFCQHLHVDENLRHTVLRYSRTNFKGTMLVEIEVSASPTFSDS